MPAEARKIQLTGGSTYTVSLPKQWAREMRLRPGETVFLEQVRDTLVLRRKGEERKEPSVKVLHVERKEPREHLLRKLVGAYVTGFQFIDLRFPSGEAASTRAIAREFSRMVIGAEVVEETSGRVLIQDLANPMELSPDKCLRRMYMTVRSMAEDSITALKEKDPKLAEDVPPRDQDVDRLYWMVAKQYHLAVTDSSYMVAYNLRGKLHHFRTVAKLLERIGDHAEKIALAVINLGGEGQEEAFIGQVEEVVTRALVILEKAFTALMADDMAMANDALDGWEALQKRVGDLSRKVSGATGPRLVPLATIVDSVSRIGGYGSDVAEVAINSVISRED